MLKTIGTSARVRLEELLERKVFLSLFVKVKPGWREDASFLNTVDWRSMVGNEAVLVSDQTVAKKARKSAGKNN
jgi:hypothetical protein